MDVLRETRPYMLQTILEIAWPQDGAIGFRLLIEKAKELEKEVSKTFGESISLKENMKKSLALEIREVSRNLRQQEK